MRLRNMLLSAWAAGLLLCATGQIAQAVSMSYDLGSVTPDDVFVSGNLEFSDFRFHSPGCGGVDPSDLTLTILDDGVEIAGPLTVTGPGRALFFVSYQVTALDLPIDGVSLSLEASVEGDHFPLVLATKRVIGDYPEKPSGHPWNHHGWGPPPGSSSGHPGGKHTLAFLKTAAWGVSQDCCSCLPHWEWLCQGEFLLDQESFEPQESVKVIDAVFLTSWKSGETASFVSSTNSFSTVPEPTSAVLLVMGLSGLAFAGRRRP